MPRPVNRNPDEAPPYRVAQVAEKWDVSEKAVLDALKRGRIPGFKLGRMWLIPRESVDRLSRGGRT